MKTLIRVALLVVAGSAGAAGHTAAQEPVPELNSRIRVVLADGKEILGEFQAWTDEDLSMIAPISRVGNDRGVRRSRVLEKGEVREVWLKTGERTNMGRHLGQVAKITVLGALIGAGVGYASADRSDWLFSPGDYAAMGAIGFAVPLAIGGVLWAAVTTDDVWTRVSPAWEPSGGKADSGWAQNLDWSAGITSDGGLGLTLTLRR